ncbi:acyl-CoA N-acyltransferase [Microdochium bolleyi]|uniref:Acyl-CoA N-acyltransferase n=1 Tax=Microdochium bolleyi TaxID=196109 RepID=A0A136IJJ5_9PEZI|nr:acyl-CoA N-acyltransferase [Microdochium bolleyi]
MPHFTHKLDLVFQTKNLIYRALENTSADKKFIFDAVQSGTASSALACPVLFLPAQTQRSADWVDSLLKSSLLAVVACLPGSVPEWINDAPGSKEAKALVPIGLLTLSKSPDSIAHCRDTELGVFIAEPFQNQGYGAEAVGWALDWAFRFAGVHRVSANTIAFNTRSIHLWQKLGFRDEGRKRDMIYFDLQWWDWCSFGLLQHEWVERRCHQHLITTSSS